MIISHNLHDIFEVADRITVLRLGRAVAVFEREKTTQQEVVHAITAGVADEGRRASGRPTTRARPDDGADRRSTAARADPIAAAEVAETGRTATASARTSAAGGTASAPATSGSLPIIVGLLLITIFFQTKNDNFLTAGNISNLIVQMAATATIAMGVVFVLLLGEIDLSIGFVSGIAGVVVAELQTGGNWTELPGWLAILVAVLVCAAIGLARGLVRRLHRRAVVHRHARVPARAAGRDPEADRRDRRDRDPGPDDLQRRELLPPDAAGWIVAPRS